ncbi:hypothetical protein [Parabacteroides sp. AM08-6]|uniref:hypothetical protein n=1 Tax=Parabacteroides sp. AM08-6 TaxID=2292053 RepID=UPI000EFFDE84|nr:hypothetical protein [Parabacteroides sp. AM08-6]RHJ87608.1 hypothetical protein DW103_00040 [Parabacteroides sp. AM08-6]
MKGRIILYGWLLSWILMIGGLGTMEWAMETGEPVFILGLFMFMVFVIFCLLVIKYQKEADKAADEFDHWFERTFGNTR